MKQFLDDLPQLALSLLARRDYLYQELQQKLLQYCADEVVVNETLESLKWQGYLNDDRVIKEWISLKINKGLGISRIKQELAERGVDLERYQAYLPADWNDLIEKNWRKRFKGVLPESEQDKAKQYRFLLYRGFTEEQIEQLFKQLHMSEHYG